MVTKLLMNYVYGKTISKPIETDTIIRNSRHDCGKYVALNYRYVDSVVNGRYYIEKFKSVMPHYNYVHAGVETLSMSKRIMNKVCPCSDDLNNKIDYQHTDSIHLKYDDVDKIVDRYNDNYNQDLVDTGLG